jgi:hypothetical protein
MPDIGEEVNIVVHTALDLAVVEMDDGTTMVFDVPGDTPTGEVVAMIEAQDQTHQVEGYIEAVNPAVYISKV